MLAYLAPVLLLSLQAPTTEPGTAQQPSADEDAPIVVTAERLRKFRARVKTRRKTGEVYCDMRRSSGDAAFDRALCGQLVRCHAVVDRSSAVRQVKAGDGSRKELERAGTIEFERCLAPFFESHGIDRE
ncbi:hypothetical protein [Alteriqipengyuania lutimaris]|uniref:Uncharacterized protein n=1 Tax=Alteriqipengyuania lutimaris TaxID=1538146 RepID=A0A395LIY3_9SPHN|nr:hypothetical protein [Alteriqipengyuania lutimaris]MBB3034146.1 hypothetical protein [Alteriqipengyuania lutimaris]RDS76923.1 hypothetical protein DL238_04415 [Alteriqipengyuania lutimaris]